MTKAADLAGQRFRSLTVIERAGSRGGHSLWKCICDCGKKTVVANTNLKQGTTSSCGCLVFKRARERLVDISGQRYGNISVIRFIKRTKTAAIFECVCDCGRRFRAKSNPLRMGTQKTCGCGQGGQRTHGLSKAPEYDCWIAMKQRCLNPNCPAFRAYGARGITVSDRWLGSGGFERFVEDIGRRPTRKHSIDRIDNNGNYEPGNVRWATQRQQLQNRRTTRWIVYKGKRFTQRDLARLFDVPFSTVFYHADRGRDGDWIAKRLKAVSGGS